MMMMEQQLAETSWLTDWFSLVYYAQGAFPDRCNKGLVELEKVDTPEDIDDLESYIKEHVAYTGSTVGKEVSRGEDSR